MFQCFARAHALARCVASEVFAYRSPVMGLACASVCNYKHIRHDASFCGFIRFCSRAKEMTSCREVLEPGAREGADCSARAPLGNAPSHAAVFASQCASFFQEVCPKARACFSKIKPFRGFQDMLTTETKAMIQDTTEAFLQRLLSGPRCRRRLSDRRKRERPEVHAT